MSVASLHRIPRFPTLTALYLPGRRAGRRRAATQPRLIDALLEDRTLLAFSPISQPTAAYVADTTLLPITDPDFSVVLALSDPSVTVTFDIPLVALTTPSTWSTWGSPPDTEGSTPRVLWTDGLTSLTLTSSLDLTTFGLEVQPATLAVSTITATFFANSSQVGEITRDVDGFGGALLFAGTSTIPFNRVVVSSPTDDFAIAQVRYALPVGADLSIVKTDSPDPVNAGANLTYTLQATNNGPLDALNATITDALPAGTTFVSATAPAGWSLTTPAVGVNGTVFATNSSFAPGTSVITIVAKVDSNVASGSTLSNTATISSTSTDPDGTNNSDTETTSVTTSADLAISKTDTPDPVNAGANLTYTITLTNNGPSDAQTVSVSDTLPAGTTFVSATAPVGWTTISPAVGGTGTVTFTRPTVAAGATPGFTIVVNVNPNVPSGTTISNTATATTATTDPNSGNDSSTTTTTVSTSADLAVTKTDTPDPVIAGTNLTYTVTLANNGPSDAQGVVLSDVVPAGTTFLSAVGPAGWGRTTPAVGGTGAIAFTKSTVSPSETGTFTIVVRVDASAASGSTISNTATATTTTTDPDPTNNNASAFTTVNTSADLAVTKIDTPDPVIAGTNLTYTIVLSNNGPSDAQSVSIADTLPAGTTFVSAGVPVGWSATTPAVGGTGTVALSRPTFAAGVTTIFTIVVHVNANVLAGTTITNSATAASSTSDPNSGNNTGTTTTAVVASADLSITKTDLNDPVVAGTDVTYTISVTNNGPSDAQSYNVPDTLPAGTTLVSYTQTSGPPVFGVLPAGSTASFQLIATVNSNVPSGTVLTNSVTATSTTPDPNSGNSTATATTTVITSADLVVSKVASPSPVTVGSNLTYIITLSNNGPSDAQAVSLTDGIPAGTTFVAASAPGGWTTTTPVVGGTGTVTFARASFAAGASPTFTIVVQVSSSFNAPAVSNTVNVSSTTPDPNSGNNSFTANTPVNSPVDLVVTKSASPNPVFAGGNLTYTVSVQNLGSLPAANVTLYDLLPDRTTFVSNSGAPGWSSTNPPVGSPGIITSTIPSFGAGATATFIIVVRVATEVRTGAVLTNRAVVITSSSELNGTNNSTTASVIVGSPPAVFAPAVKSVAATAPGGSQAGTHGPNAGAIIAKVQDLAIARSGGLVADVLRQKALSGLLAFGG